MVDLLPHERPRGATAEALRHAARKGWAELAPGKWARRHPGKAPAQVICRVMQNPDGSFRFVPMEERLVKITPGLCRLLGLGDRGSEILHYLGRAGFVEVARPAPKVAQLNLDSYYNHLRRTVEDPEFWSKRGNIEAYRAVLPAGVTARPASRNAAKEPRKNTPGVRT